MSIVLLLLFAAKLVRGQIPQPMLPVVYPTAAVAYTPVMSANRMYGHSSECALVLQRTFVNGKRKSPMPQYNGFMDLFKPP